jgi:hypothetical protein
MGVPTGLRRFLLNPKVTVEGAVTTKLVGTWLKIERRR